MQRNSDLQGSKPKKFFKATNKKHVGDSLNTKDIKGTKPKGTYGTKKVRTIDHLEFNIVDVESPLLGGPKVEPKVFDESSKKPH